MLSLQKLDHSPAVGDSVELEGTPDVIGPVPGIPERNGIVNDIKQNSSIITSCCLCTCGDRSHH